MSLWYFSNGQEQQGPVDEVELKARLAAGTLPPETFVWQEGMENWLHAHRVPALNGESAPAAVRPSRAIPSVSLKPADYAPVRAKPATGGCVECHSPDVVLGFPTALCQPCRDKYVRRAIPLWLKGAAAGLALLFVISAFRLPAELSAAIALQRADSAEARGDHAAAMTEYKTALASYPNAQDALRGMARAALAAGDVRAALDYANRIVAPGGEISKDDLALIKRIKAAQK